MYRSMHVQCGIPDRCHVYAYVYIYIYIYIYIYRETRVNVSTLCIHNPAGCFGLGFLWNVIPRVCGRGLVIWCGKRARGADGFEFRSHDKGNPRVSKCQIISTRTLSRLVLTSISGEVAIASIARENAGNFVSRMVPNGRSSFVARLSF